MTHDELLDVAARARHRARYGTEYSPETCCLADVRPVVEALAPLLEAAERLRATLTTISAIRDSIVGAQAFNWSEHAYPLVAALADAGFPGAGYEVARANMGTLIERCNTAEAREAALREALVSVLAWGVEHDDPRIGYVTVQVDRPTVHLARAALATPSPVTDALLRVIESARAVIREAENDRPVGHLVSAVAERLAPALAALDAAR